MSKKIVTVALTASTVLWSLGVTAIPAANAQSASGIQAQIQALLAQIAQLQSQLGTSSGSTGMSAYNFTRDLTVGSKGADVSALQQLLINKGYLTAVSAPTGFFGPATQKALVAFQSANGISPAAGYFGPKTRAFVNSMSTGTTGGTTTGGTTTGGTTTGGTTSTSTTTSTAPASGLSVSLSSSNPAGGSLVTSASGGTSAARIPVLAINLTASASGAVTVTQILVHKTGVLADSSIAGAYLIQNGQVLYQYNSLSKGTITFSGLNYTVPAGQTQTLWVAVDPSTGLAAGNTVAFALNAATDVTAADVNNNAVTAAGSFPLQGNTFTVTTVQNPSLAGLTITTSSIGTQVTAGTQGNIVGAWTFNGANNLVWLNSIKFTVIGSANMSDLRNVKLYVNGTQVGQTLPTVASNGAAYFNLATTPATLNTGNNNVQVYADVMGSPSKNFQFEVLNSYDVNAIDSQYNVPILLTSLSGIDAVITIQQGQITVTQDSGTPTGNIAQGQSGVTLAKFDVYAAGEPVKVKFLDFEIDLTGASSGLSLSQQLKNLAITDDAGNQVGTTINTPPSSNVCTANGTAAYTTSTGVYKDCFGTSGSPINYIVAANTTRVLSLKADVQSTAVFTSVVGKLNSEASNNNLQGLISSQLASSAGAAGSTLTLQTSLLTVSSNAAYGNQTFTPNSTGMHVGSYAFTASSASGVQINTVSVKAVPNGTNNSGDIQNLKVLINGTQFGTTQGVVTDAGTYTFSGAPFTVPAGGTTYVDVYADILSSAATSLNPATQLTGCSGTGVVSYNAISCVTFPNGQNVTVSTVGTTMSVGLDSSAPAASNLVMGTTQNAVAAYRFTETQNIENVKVTDLTVVENTTSSKANYQNVTLYNGATALGTAGSASSVVPTAATATITFGGPSNATGTYSVTIDGQVITSASVNSGSTSSTIAAAFAAATMPAGVTASVSGSVVTLSSSNYNTVSVVNATQNNASVVASVGSFGTFGGYAFAFHFAVPIIVPQANSLTLTLKGDVPTYASAGASDNTTSTFQILSVTALGASSNLTTAVTGGAVGNTMTVLRTVITPTATALGVASGRVKSSVDNFATLTFSANAAGAGMLRSVTVTFSGNAVSSTATSTFVLNDTNNANVLTADNAVQSGSACTATSCTVTWTFSTTTTPFIISGGSSYSFTLQLNDTALGVAGSSNSSVSLGATYQANTAVQYYDNSTATGTLIGLPTTIVPMNINTVTFAPGS